MVPHFFRSLAGALEATLHVEVTGENSHHMIEAVFKGVGRAFRAAALKSGGAELPSTKGIL
jgi:imidazoleglycerol phosphate dehydratase HisB